MEMQTMFFWIITAFVVVFTLFLIGGLFWSIGPEGRFHWGRFFRRGGIDLLKYTPLSKELTMSKIKWDGKYWLEGKDVTMLGLDTLKESSATAERYNSAVNDSGRWAGSKRPVLLALQEMCFVFSHGYLDMIKRASRLERFIDKNKEEDNPKQKAIEEQNKEHQDFIDELEKVKDLVKEGDTYKLSKAFIDNLLSQVQAGYTGLKIHTIVTADEISRYVEGATPRVLQESRLEGRAEGALEMTKPEKNDGLPPMAKAVAISAAVIMTLVIAYVVITGQNPVDSIKGVLPG